MRWVRHSGLTVVLVNVLFLAIGCADKEKKQIEYLSQQKLELENANKDLRSQLASARNRESDLLAQVESKDLSTKVLQTENADLRQKLAGAGKAPPGPPPGPPEGGGETAVYKVTVGSDILFGAGQAVLTPEGMKRLDVIAREIRGKYAGMTVRVLGYTDADPVRRSRKLWQDNLDLSANRAMAVTRHLISKSIPEDHVETVGMGATHPVAPNTTAADKAKNRRVVIMVIKS